MMNVTCGRRLTLFLLFLCLPQMAAYAQDIRNIQTLKGLSGVVLRVKTIGGISAKAEDAVAKRVEADLMKAGIKLHPEQEFRPKSDVGRLDLTMTLICVETSCGFTTRLSLSQGVQLLRDGGIFHTAVTWGDAYQNAIAKSELAALQSLITIDATTLVNIFIEDYLSANQ
jgi:hypothetical protein